MPEGNKLSNLALEVQMLADTITVDKATISDLRNEVRFLRVRNQAIEKEILGRQRTPTRVIVTYDDGSSEVVTPR